MGLIDEKTEGRNCPFKETFARKGCGIITVNDRLDSNSERVFIYIVNIAR
jgi:hypothetical protein